MLKIFVCHFLTKLHPFSTYEGGKSKKVFLGLPIGHPPPRRDRNRSASPIYSFLTWKQLEEANTRHLLDLGPGWYIDLLWIAKHTFCWGYLIFWSRTFAKGIYLNFQRKISNKVTTRWEGPQSLSCNKDSLSKDELLYRIECVIKFV